MLFGGISFKETGHDTAKQAAPGPAGLKNTAQKPCLQTALNLYWTEGVAALSVNDLVRRMGMPKPSLYRHFRSEDALQASVLLAYEAGPLARLNEMMTARAVFIPAGKPIQDALIDGITGHPQGCLLFQMRESQARLGPRAAAASDAVFARYVAR